MAGRRRSIAASGDRVPAHPPPAHLRTATHDAEGHRREDGAEPDGRLHHGLGDEVPPAIEQLGVKVEMLSADELAWGDLSRFNTIVTGVRAYERRDDLRANNSRLLEYVRNGGTLIVQYNKFEFNDAYGPYPGQVSNNRVTDERRAGADPGADASRVHHAERDHGSGVEGLGAGARPVLPRREGSRYRDLVELVDSFPNNPGEKSGALVEGRTERADGCTSGSACGASCRPAWTARISCSRT